MNLLLSDLAFLSVAATVSGGGSYLNAVQNFMDNNLTAATNGVAPLTGGTPFWTDILSLNADLDLYATSSFNNVMDGSTATYVYWTGNQYNIGNVTNANLELVPRIAPAGQISSVRVFGGFPIGGPYIPYTIKLLDAGKNEIAGTSVTYNIGVSSAWLEVPVAGSPYYLNFSATSGANRRFYLHAIEVNGSILVDT